MNTTLWAKVNCTLNQKTFHITGIRTETQRVKKNEKQKDEAHTEEVELVRAKAYLDDLTYTYGVLDCTIV